MFGTHHENGGFFLCAGHGALTWRCNSSGSPDRGLAESQLRRRESSWEGSGRQCSSPRNTKRIGGDRLADARARRLAVRCDPDRAGVDATGGWSEGHRFCPGRFVDLLTKAARTTARPRAGVSVSRRPTKNSAAIQHQACADEANATSNSIVRGRRLEQQLFQLRRVQRKRMRRC